MELSYAEIFLMVWAGVATIVAVLINNKANMLMHHTAVLSNLVAEMAYGDVKPTIRDDGFYVVENDDLRMAFKKKE